MSYEFNTMTEQEIMIKEKEESKSSLVEDGVYDFEIIKSTRKISQSSGNPMAHLQIKFWDKEGRTKNLFDYLVFSNTVFSTKKIRHFCLSIGKPEFYEKGSLPDELAGYSGKFKLITQAGSLIPDDKLGTKPKGSRYQDRNVVEDYVVLSNNNIKEKKENEKFFDDDVPF